MDSVAWSAKAELLDDAASAHELIRPLRLPTVSEHGSDDGTVRYDTPFRSKHSNLALTAVVVAVLVAVEVADVVADVVCDVVADVVCVVVPVVVTVVASQSLNVLSWNASIARLSVPTSLRHVAASLHLTKPPGVQKTNPMSSMRYAPTAALMPMAVVLHCCPPKMRLAEMPLMTEHSDVPAEM